MNFLAHLYLSGTSDNIKFGNMIGDSVKGKNYQKYEAEISKGIILHRHIDTFTDSHEIIRECKQLFNEKFHKHSGVVIDIVFDHFLALNWKQYSDKDLHAFARHTYVILVKNYKLVPTRLKFFMAYMIVNNWLGSYQNISFIKRVFDRMPYRTSLPREPEFVINTIEENRDWINQMFKKFFEELIADVTKNYDIDFIEIRNKK